VHVYELLAPVCVPFYAKSNQSLFTFREEVICMKMSAIDWITSILVIIGGLNWGLIGFFDYNLVDSIFGAGSTISTVVYAIVGLSALWMIVTISKKSA
jgi:uncharacterized protein